MNLKSISALSALAVAATAPAATLYQRAQIDLSPVTTITASNYIGQNAIAVAWDGTNAYVAGFNSGAAAGQTALLTVANAVTAPTFSANYGVNAATPSGRGYANADFKTGTGSGFSYYDGSNLFLSEYAPNSTTATFSNVNTGTGANPAGGLSYDTASSRLSYVIQNSGLVRNVDTATGGSTGSSNSNIGPTQGTAFRDFDYDANGNVFARVNNKVVLSTRTDATTFGATPTLLANPTNANNVGENINVVEGFGGAGATRFAIYNDRGTTAAGQAFTSVVKGIRADGTAETLNFLSADGTTAASVAGTTSAALYDFSYDTSTQTLAVLDFANNQLYIFGATASAPEPTALTAIGGLLMLCNRRRRA